MAGRAEKLLRDEAESLVTSSSSESGIPVEGPGPCGISAPLSIHIKIEVEDKVGFIKMLCPLSLCSFKKFCDKIHITSNFPS